MLNNNKSVFEVSVQRLGLFPIQTKLILLFSFCTAAIKSRPSSWEKPFIPTPDYPLEEQQQTKTWLVGASRNTDMFTAIARLLFGGEEKTADDAQPSGDVVDEGWLLLNHRGYLLLYYYYVTL